MEPKFTGPSFTIGIEEELMILDSETLALANAIEAVLEEHGENEQVKPELLESVLEIATTPHPDTRAAGRQLRALRSAVSEAAQRRDLCIGSAGTHPIAMWEDQRVSSRPRYRELIAALRFVARQEIIFGLHVHVGMRDGEHAVAMLNGFLPYLPHVLALSASSPFWRSQDTGLAASRLTTYESHPTAGMPVLVRDWAEFSAMCELMRRTGSIQTLKDIWWDLRPSPKYGTLELRMCDGPATMRELGAIVAFVHAAARWFQAKGASYFRDRPCPPLRWVLRENKWRASRWGRDADVLIDTGGGTRPLREELGRLACELEPYAARVGASAGLAAAREMLAQPPSYERQRTLFARHGSLLPVTDALIAELATDRPACTAAASVA